MAGTRYEYRINEMPPMVVTVRIGHRVKLRLWAARLLVAAAAWVLQAGEVDIDEETLD
jgi:hypothetical protein